MGELQSQKKIIRMAPNRSRLAGQPAPGLATLLASIVTELGLHIASFGLRAASASLGLALALLLVTATGLAWVQYKWKDSRGQVHVSDLPPPRDIPEKDVLQRPAAPRTPTAAAAAPATAALPASATAPAKPATDPELEARRKRAELAASAKAKADADKLAAQRADNCQRARQQLETLNNGQRLVQFNAQGERVVMDDTARNAAAAQARQVVATDCR
jgi:hypothetical protein